MYSLPNGSFATKSQKHQTRLTVGQVSPKLSTNCQALVYFGDLEFWWHFKFFIL
jgi:membrane carboxypeptidase/penicillin-binding protein PbpC